MFQAQKSYPFGEVGPKATLTLKFTLVNTTGFVDTVRPYLNITQADPPPHKITAAYPQHKNRVVAFVFYNTCSSSIYLTSSLHRIFSGYQRIKRQSVLAYHEV